MLAEQLRATSFPTARHKPCGARAGVIEHGTGLCAQFFRDALLFPGAGTRILVLVELVFRAFQRSADLTQPRRQLRQLIRGRFEPLFFIAQSRYFHRERIPVEVGEVGVLLQLGKLVSRACTLFDPPGSWGRGCPAHRVGRLGASRGFKGGDLGFVGPSQYISAAIIQAMTIILFMTSPGALIWPARVIARVSRRNCSWVLQQITRSDARPRVRASRKTASPA